MSTATAIVEPVELSRTAAPTAWQARVRRLPRVRSCAVGVALTGAAGMGYLVSENPHALPPHLAVAGRVAVIIVLAGAGLYASLDPVRMRMGAWLLGASVFACIWLLNGSRAALPFTVGMAASGVAPIAMYSLLLLQPSGHLRSTRVRLFVWVSAGLSGTVWLLLMLVSSTPPLATPLLRCGHHCPRNLLYTAASIGVEPALRAIALIAWVSVSAGTLVILSTRYKRASRPARRMLLPVEAAAVASVLLVAAFVITHAAGAHAASPIGTVYFGVVLAIPAAIFGGLYLERAYLGAALARLMDRLPRATPASVEQLLIESLADPALRLALESPEGSWTDPAGRPVDVERAMTGRAVAEINRAGLPVAVVIFDRELAEQSHLIAAAGEAALMALNAAKLQERLESSADELASARRHAVDAVIAERQRFARDLHDGAQQRLLAMRMRLGAAQLVRGGDLAQIDDAMVELGRELDAILTDLRALAISAYPPALSDYGLERALDHALARGPARLHSERLGRYSPAIEAAVYFTIIEAVQNALKHSESASGPDVSISEDRAMLRFEVADEGAGFELDNVRLGAGILSMRERIEAIGGILSVTSRSGRGTVVAGSAPIGSSPSVGAVRTAGTVAWPA